MMHPSGLGAHLRVSLPRVQRHEPGGGGDAARQYRPAGGRERTTVGVPLPAALFLFLLLALVFHHQLKQIATEADELVRV